MHRILTPLLLSAAVLLSGGYAKSREAGGKPPFRVLERAPERLVFALAAFEPQIASFEVDGQRYQTVRIPEYALTDRDGAPALPQTSALVQIPPDAKVSVRVLESDFEVVDGVRVAPAPTWRQTGRGEQGRYELVEDATVYAADRFWPANLVTYAGSGWLRGRRLARIAVHPVQYNPVRRQLRVYHTLKVEVRFSGGTAARAPFAGPESATWRRQLRRLVLNPEARFGRPRPTQRAQPPRPSSGDWYQPDFTYFKLMVDRDGIYALRLADFAAFGLEAPSFNLPSLKLFNRGREIPVWIDGPPGTTFTEQHTLYFYGERNRPADGGYFDFYSDDNVYWLTADGGPGLRYTLATDSIAEGHAPPYTWHRLHLEQDNAFHRANASTEVDPEEGWVWRFFFPNDVEEIRFRTSGVFFAVESCSLRLRLHGTTKDPAEPDHHVRLSLNGEPLAETYFDDEEELLWSLVLPTARLREGLNRLRLHLVPDTPAQVNQIYLDWIELTYPRVRAAEQAELRFSDPAPSGQLTRYDLWNFPDRRVRLFSPGRARLWRAQVSQRSVYRVESAGFDDGNGVRITADFQTFEFGTRGHHLVSLNAVTGEIETRSFDTFGSQQEADALAAYVGALPDGSVVLVGIADEGSANMTENAYRALESLGSALTRQVGHRDSWALVGWKGAQIGSVAEVLSPRFSGPAVATDTLSGAQAFRFAATFADTALAGNTYVAVSDSGVRRVRRIERDRPSRLRQPAEGADYLVITHQEFRAPAQRLANYRAEHNGYRTAVVDVQDIYDEFNAGVIHPRAIRDFLAYAYENWPPPAPTFVLLLGDASWDPRRRLPESSKTNYVPSYGILVSDTWYVMLDGPDDRLPDLFIGRIPAETPEQAARVIDKTLAYEATPFDLWNKEFLFLNGGINAVEQSIFSGQGRILAQGLVEAPPLFARVQHFNKTTNEAITRNFERLIGERIRQGVLWVNFLGHAGSAVWDIDAGMPEDWQNRLFPFMTGMSCHSARFANPIRNSLSELYVLHEAGAAAYWGSSGFGYVSQDFFLLEGLFGAVVQDTVRSVGEATTAAKWHVWQRLPESKRTRYVIEQYALIGDPALELRVPEQPELAVRDSDIRFPGRFLVSSDSTTTVSARVWNVGLLPQDSVDVRLESLGPEEELAPIATLSLPPLPYSDSLAVPWWIPTRPGTYRVRLTLDPEARIPEADTRNNVAAADIEVFTSDLTLVKPLPFGVVSRPTPELVTGNSRSLRPDLTYFFEVDTSAGFSSLALQRSSAVPEGALVTRWQPDLPAPGTYFWRVRSFDGENYGPWQTASFAYLPTATFQWQQRHPQQFQQNALEHLTPDQTGALVLETEALRFEAESAGFLDGNFSGLWLNDEEFSPNQRGHNLAVFTPTGTPHSTGRFDTFARTEDAEAMATFIAGIPDGYIVLAAIRDEGSRAMTERAYQALEGLGSALTRQVGFRDSWALIGRKGAAIGTVPEAWRPAGDGAVALRDTVLAFAPQGRVQTPLIGPAQAWRTLHVDYAVPDPRARFTLRLLAQHRQAGRVDTLELAAASGQPISLGHLDPRVYPQVRLQAELVSETGRTTPTLRGWAVDFVPPPDLVLDRDALSLSADTLAEGAELEVAFKVGNFGLSATDSFDVAVRLRDPRRGEVEVKRLRLAGLQVDEVGAAAVAVPTARTSGRVTLALQVDPDNSVAEINENNNRIDFQVRVVRDTVSPEIRITVDGRPLAEGDVVSARPQIEIAMHDATVVAFGDTSKVTLLLDGTRVPYGNAPGYAELRPPPPGSEPNLRAVVVFAPELAPGEHELTVLAEDEASNVRVARTTFFVSEAFHITDVMNYPNPFRRQTAFTYILTQEADEVRLKIYTVSGLLINEYDFLPTDVGFNQFEWEARDRDGDALANGVYLYKIIARRARQQAEVVEKFVVVR